MDKKYQVTEVRPGLYQIGSVLGPRHVYQYFLKDEFGAILIDAGMPETPAQAILPFFEEIGFDPKKLTGILISHGDVDHFAGVANLSQTCQQAVIMAHEADVPWIESVKRIQQERYFAYESFDITHDEETKKWFLEHLQPTKVHLRLMGGEKWKIGPNRVLSIVHVPGHSPGHLAVYDEQNQAMMMIDAVLHKGLYDMEGKMISPPPYYSISPYLKTIDTMLQYNFDVLLTGHYDIMYGMDAFRFLHESRIFVDEVAATIEEIVRRSTRPLSLKEVLDKSNQQIGPYTAMAVELIGPVFAHLVDLEKRGILHCVMKEKIPYWFA